MDDQRIESRESRADLELGKEHLTEMKDRLDNLLADDLGLKIENQLRAVEQALEKKTEYDHDYQELLDKVRQLLLEEGLKNFRREEEKEKIKEKVDNLLTEMMKLAEAKK